MAQAYTALEQKLGGKKDETPTPQTKPAETAGAVDSARIPAAAPEVPAGIDLGKLSAELAANKGDLTDATRKSLHAKGFNNEAINGIIAGQKALHQATTAALVAVAGGPEAFKQTMQWALQNLSKDEQKAYNDAIDSGNTGMATMLLRGIRAAMVTTTGEEPSLVGAEGGAAGEAGYASKAEMTADMRNPKYQTDEAFRAKVAAKMKRSDPKKLGIVAFNRTPS